MLKPLGSNLRDGVIFVRLAGRDTSQLHGIAIAKRAKQIGVNLLLKACCLLYSSNS